MPLPPGQDFDLFIERMGEWWPLSSHCISTNRAVGVRVEGVAREAGPRAAVLA